MAQTTILTAGVAAATSSDVTITTAAPALVGLFNIAIGAPTAGTHTTAATGGVLPQSTTYYYRVSAINAVGESTAFAESSKATAAGTATNTITVKWTAVPGATGYRVYGRATGAELFIAEVGAVLEYTDTGAITPAGALPGADTTLTGLPLAAVLTVMQDTPGGDVRVGSLTTARPTMLLTGPGTYRIKRPDLSADNCIVGAFKEVA